MSFYSEEELKSLGLLRFGDGVRLSRKASIYNPGSISIGSHVRIDDFCVLSAGEGGIDIGDYVHVAVFCSLIGAAKIKVGDFANLSSRVSIYSSNDDYTGEYMSNPMVPSRFTGVTNADVIVYKHTIIGSGSVVLPGVILEEGVIIGSLSLVKDRCRAFGIYVGTPARRIGERKRHLLELEHQLRQETRNIQCEGQ
jgi:acetyltransferase-like isoleucine patch superfamily enzyme